MILAELKGKIPSKLQDWEDILTSNVFSFFKYSDRRLLKEYLLLLGIDVSLLDTKSAEFIFWFSYDDGTEPDLIVICGEYYILFEAKLFSDFSRETSNKESQILREIRKGKESAKNTNNKFVYVALTAEYYKDKTKYSKYEKQDYQFIWTNWQVITDFIENILTNTSIENDRGFAFDLYSLLVKKKLRSYIGISNLKIQYNFDCQNSVFYNIKSSKFKGEFSGYIHTLTEFVGVGQYHRFFKKTFFQNLNTIQYYSTENIFYNGN
jgi:hypothetical protein